MWHRFERSLVSQEAKLHQHVSADWATESVPWFHQQSISQCEAQTSIHAPTTYQGCTSDPSI